MMKRPKILKVAHHGTLKTGFAGGVEDWDGARINKLKLQLRILKVCGMKTKKL